MPQEQEQTYFCIDMKTFYASVECAERGLDPFETNLVVADPTRGANALCLAITPRLKGMGVRNRCRLTEIPAKVSYLVAPPRMKLYVDYAADIYGIYLRYLAPEDIHVYSIDEAFLDVTDYLRVYKVDKVAFAKQLMADIQRELSIPSTAGIGTNLYLAKIALDITAKRSPDRIGILTEETFRKTLWDHLPLSDFWGISTGTVNRLLRYGIRSMRGIAQAPEALLYKQFGINAELLIDHAWGRESCRMQDIKSYRGHSRSVSFSQILPRDYTREEARIVAQEMLLNGSHELLKRHVVTGRVSLFVGYSR
ncbi:MAG: DNA repair protein, partial [Clostridia bacterium]|nr:DNA repair protein [Clostridia bacterium]